MKNILYISYCPPYGKALNAGAQTLYYYIRELTYVKNIKVDVVTYCEDKDLDALGNEDEKIKYHLVKRPKGLQRFVGRVISLNSKYNPYHKYCNLMTYYSIELLLSKLKELSSTKYSPDVIFLEWTQIVLLIDKVKTIFPKSRIVASEPDVTYLSRLRKYENEKSSIKREYKKIQYKNCKIREIEALKKADFVFTQSEKDVHLIVDGNTINRNKVGIQIPFYHRSELEHKRKNNNILFYGAMNREENSSAVIWFIDNVMPLLKSIPVKFVVLGGGLTEQLKTRQSEDVIMKGFVPSIDKDFSEAMCFVCPLVIGAGIKVKVIEALYSNIPVITNQIGIEGISAINGKEYIHCESPEEYANAIINIYHDPDYQLMGRNVVNCEFSLKEAVDNYIKVIQELVV